MIEQYQSDRFCRGCKTWKPLAAFGVRIDRLNGRRSRCDVCTAAAKRDRKAALRERVRSERMVVPEAIAPSARELLARELCGAVQTFWHIGEPSPRFGVAMIGGGL